MTRRHLIIGSGPAALSALEAVRRTSQNDEVTLISREDSPPYSPACLPYLLAGILDEDRIWLREPGYFDRMNAGFVSGKEVVSVSAGSQSVTLHDGTRRHYDSLLIATGAEPVLPPVPGLREAGIHTFRTLQDCRRLAADLEGKRRVTILGAGLIGVHLAEALLTLGHEVYLVEKEAGLMGNHLAGEVRVLLEDALRKRGAQLLTKESIKHVERSGSRIEVTLSHTSLTTNVLICAVGVSGRSGFVEELNLTPGAAIPVNRRMETALGQVYAAGDVAAAPDFFTGELSQQAFTRSAVAQGRIAGKNMAGDVQDYEGNIPVLALNLLGNHVFSIGPLQKPAGAEVISWGDAKSHVRLTLNDDRITGALLANTNVDPGIVLQLIRKRVSIAPYRAALVGHTQPLSEAWMAYLKQ